METSKSKIITIVLVLLAVGASYYYFYGNGASSSATSTKIGDVDISEIDSAATVFLTRLNEFKSVSLDKRIFSDPAFTSLKLFEVSIPDQQVGRDNPFAPVYGLGPIQQSGKSAPRTGLIVR